jgi:hypothetical protein
MPPEREFNMEADVMGWTVLELEPEKELMRVVSTNNNGG